jgi:hypothetical protein
MESGMTDELGQFHCFIGEKLTNGKSNLSPEEALDEWRHLHPDPEDLAESVAAVREALADMHAGDRGRPVDEVLADIRMRLGLTGVE